MARIKIVEPEKATGPRRELVEMVEAGYGYVPGVFKIMLVDLELTQSIENLYSHLHLRENSPLSRLQREMVATVVNGAVGGAP